MFTVLSVALMVVDARFTLLQPLRAQLGLIVEPVYWAGRLPVRIWEGATQELSSRSELTAENEQLKAEQLMMQRRLQKLAALTEQNVRLRELLNSAALVDDEVLATELIGIDPNPFTHRILIDKGERDGVVVGQPVLDARGLMGQVVEIMPYTSRVLLLTDTTHSIPVQVNRLACVPSPAVPETRSALSCVMWLIRQISKRATCWSVPAWGSVFRLVTRWRWSVKWFMTPANPLPLCAPCPRQP